ncbi:TPA: GDP-mannose 4,6-dehydratase [Candidatus Avacholeplasma faecigallinarum]|nr:GDP-mannose 4,6-dehydratase [Candidatus Avacholeplasma faecigallinarum]
MIIFLKPYFETKPWAGNELNKIYDCNDKTGEAWIVSGYKNKSSIIVNGKYKGKTLRWLWFNHPELFNGYKDKEFPLLVKLISASENLSVQVHPNDDYALKKHNQLGKFECWYILNETKASSITLGVNVKNAQELKEVIENNKLENYLWDKKIEPNDLVVVEPGRVHAIHGGTFLLEVQESSDITYRLYDYNRLPKRQLHIEDSLNVIDYNNNKNLIFDFKQEDTFKNSHFNLYKLIIDGEQLYENKGFEIFYVISGNGSINNRKIAKGDTFILTSNIERIEFKGNLELIAVIPKPKQKERLKMRKVALITGVVGQDGYYLTELLLEKNYEVHGIVQSMSQINNSALNKYLNNENFFVHIGDLTDASNINRILENVKPDEIYHLASQSHVDLSYEIPEYTAQVNALGTLRLLDAIKSSEIKTKLFNMSTAQLFSGDIYPQNEDTPFDPSSPYAISKLYAHYIVKSYRTNYNLYAVNGICYNHESAIKDSSFVSKKIVEGVKRCLVDKNFVLKLGNLNATREWGHAKDYALAMWIMLQQEVACDYVIATGEAYTVREFATKAFAKKGIKLKWLGEYLEEKAIDEETNRVLIEVSLQFLRPVDAKILLGDSTKFQNKTSWHPQYDIDKLLDSMFEGE